MSEALAIEIRDLIKVYRKSKEPVRAVDRLSLTVERGEVFGLLGPNGAGKTTTVEICEGLLEQTSGSVTVLGSRWTGADALALRQRIGVSLQETRFFERQTVTEILTMFRSFYSEGYRVGEAIELVALGEKAETRYGHLSGGQRQRLAVACAVIGRPELLFLDEPTTGLDPTARRQLWAVVRSFRDAGGTVLLTTHYMDEAEQLSDRVGIMDHGRLLALGTPMELIASLGGEHVIEVSVSGDAAAFAGERLESLPGLSAHRVNGGALSLTVDAVHRTMPALLEELRRADLALEGMMTRHTTLEDLFVRLTGRHLRDEGQS